MWRTMKIESSYFFLAALPQGWGKGRGLRQRPGENAGPIFGGLGHLAEEPRLGRIMLGIRPRARDADWQAVQEPVARSAHYRRKRANLFPCCGQPGRGFRDRQFRSAHGGVSSPDAAR